MSDLYELLSLIIWLCRRIKRVGNQELQYSMKLIDIFFAHRLRDKIE